MQIPIDVRRFPGIRRLAADYAHNFGSVAPFFAGDPANPDAWGQAIARTQAHPRRRDELAALIAAQQERRGAPAAAREAGARLSDPRTVGILTGQQAGLFGGPMYTLLKALTALKLAEQVSRDHRVPAVAIFWIEAEDHDWDEVRSCTVFGDQFEPRTVSLGARAGEEAIPVARTFLDESVTAAIDELSKVLPSTEFTASVLDHLRQAYTPGAGMAEAFGRWLEHVLGSRGLILFDASDPAAKPLVSSLFVRELSNPGQTVHLAAAAGADLTARGYHAQVQAQVDGVALFRLEDARRTIRRLNGGFVVGDSTYPAAALVREAGERPTTFSPGVLLRPVVQDTLFPTACYVAGPNELAYLGQLRAIYEHFGVPMPLIYPRASATVLDAGSLRFLNKYHLSLEALQPQDEAALNTLLQAQIPATVEQAFTAAGQTIETQMAELIRAVPAVDPTLEGAAQSTLGRMRHDLEALHGKLIQATKRRDETLRRQYMRARACAFPQGRAQERMIGLVWFLTQYGPGLVDRLHDDLPLDIGHHWALAI